MTTTPEHAGAVERLTKWADEWPHWKCTDEVVDAIKSALAALSRADARVLELVGALEPFARAFLQYGVSPSVPDHLDLVMGVTLGDFRAAAAAAALNATSPGMGSGDEKAALVSDSGHGALPMPSPTSEGL